MVLSIAVLCSTVHASTQSVLDPPRAKQQTVQKPRGNQNTPEVVNFCHSYDSDMGSLQYRVHP